MVPMAWLMSPMRLPATACSIPAYSARSVTAMSSSSSGRGVPTTKDTAASPTQPSRIAPKSMLTRSPSCSAWSLGMPWTITSLTDEQITPGKGVGAKPGW